MLEGCSSRPSCVTSASRPQGAPSARPLSPPPWPSPALPQGPGPQPSCAPLLAGPGPLRSPPIWSPLIREQRPRAGSAAAVGRHRTHQLLSGSSPALLSQACVTVTRKCTPPTSHTRTRIHVPHTCIRTTHVRAQTHTDTHTRLYGELRPRATLFLIHRPHRCPPVPGTRPSPVSKARTQTPVHLLGLLGTSECSHLSAPSANIPAKPGCEVSMPGHQFFSLRFLYL